MPKLPSSVPIGYTDLLLDLKERIQHAQMRAATAVNQALVSLYWEIGQAIRLRQQQKGWGAGVIDRLSADLRVAFPEMKGFSPRNLRYMQAFAAAWSEESILQAPLAELSWYHHLTLIEKLQNAETRIWYAQRCVAYGWSRDVMALQIQSALHQREGQAQENFSTTLPKPQSDLARQTLKDPYFFDFLRLGKEVDEREVELALIAHIRSFLLELGVGFAFVGNQYPLQVGDREFFVDLLFYHLKLRCFVVIELKARQFEPEHAGKMNFYLTAVDKQLRHPSDNPSIGVILCRTKDRLVVEYALHDVHKPIGVAEYLTTTSLPDPLKGSIPTIEELEAGLAVSGADMPEAKRDGEQVPATNVSNRSKRRTRKG
jgi:predicted nuclease of restriction endonuclease-like (RecB) superfamily